MTGSIATDDIRAARRKYDYTFFDYPRDIPWKNYDEARKIFVDRVADVPGIVSVYESGRPSTRGISDIDLIVVVEESIDDTDRIRATIEDAKTDEYYFFHGPEVLTRDVFEVYHSVLPQPSELHHLWGERLSYKSERGEFTALAYLVDSLNTTYPREFLEFLFLPSLTHSHELRIVSQDLLSLVVPQGITRQIDLRLDVRLAIHRLNSFRNDINMFLSQYERENEMLSWFDDAITDLRQEWFDLDDQEETLLRRLEDAVTAAFVLTAEIRDYLDTVGICVDATKREIRTGETYSDIFVTEWSRSTGERESVRNFVERGIPSCLLPQMITVNQRLRADPTTVTAPDAYKRTVTHRDEVAAKREASMESYKYHPLRSQYLTSIRALNRAKIRLFSR